jgi:rubrerythrin
VSIGTLLEQFAASERRALELYRRFAERFAADPETARLWLEMSNVEAAHFAILRLAVDTVRMGRGGSPDPVLSGSPAAAEGSLAALEARAAGGALTPLEAVQAALTLEQEELPRIRQILSALPPRARGSLLGGLVQGLPAHYACLGRLAARGGAPEAARAALAALEEEARRLDIPT